MRILGAVLAILYGLLMLFAVIKGKQKGIGSVLIALGAVLALVYSLLSLIMSQSYIYILIAGMPGISAGALVNGIKQKNVHIPHHIIRLIAEGAIIAVCCFG
ncbi:MAG TPA: hypothetical protein DDX91_04480 [Ruminococcaceae bacterium]|nr:hypothetical protein [Oscillospiraceae bacterium]